ncbi:MAG TPA: aldo/keto reductase [Bryobacteraceae bacterium]|nr:aldo/keto reductase [Bryobacteraceae bacterium]
MHFRTIGSLQVSAVGLGCNNFGWRIDEKASAEVVHAALSAGVTFFDTADIYGSGQSEEFLGRALGSRRSEAVIGTKFGMRMDEQRQGAKPEYVRRACEDSLRRLGADYIDLYQLHQPDPQTPIADTLGALDDMVREGKVREIGCSNFNAEQLRAAELAAVGRARFVSVQNEYSMIRREAEREVLPECERLGLAFLPYFPLASGLLTGKYRPGAPLPAGSRGEAGWGPKVFTEQNLAVSESLRGFAERRGHTLLDLAFSWLLAHRAVASVIAGATSPKQVTANAAAGEWPLSAEELREVDEILSGVA